MHTPPWQASPLVQVLPSSQGVASATAVPVHSPLWQVAPVEQALPSSQLAPVSGATVQLAVPLQVRVLHWSEVQMIAVPTHCPSLVQVSSNEQALPSSQLAPVSGATVQLAVPLQVRVLHWSEVQVMAVPTHCPPLVQVSLTEQALPSSHSVPVSGAIVQLAVPLQVRVLHWSEVHVMAVPTHWPPLLHVSLNEQVLPSSHAAPVLGVTVQLAVPLQVRVLHVSEVHVTAVLWQTPASQVSAVQAFWSSQSAAVEQSLQPGIFVYWQRPETHESDVQAFWSLQSAAFAQIGRTPTQFSPASPPVWF